MLFIGLLRHLVAHPQANSGLFAGLVAMREQPQAARSLQSLAERAAMSRIAFATRFKDASTLSRGWVALDSGTTVACSGRRTVA